MKRAFLFAALLLAPGASVTAADPACDRACMSKQLDRYLLAVAAHTPATAPLGKAFRATENGIDVTAGEGLWKSATGFGPMQRRYFDPESRQAAFYGAVYEAAGPALLSLRVRFEGDAIVESEAVIARKGEPLYNPAAAIADQPRGELSDRPRPKAPRADMVQTAKAYFTALGGGDPAKVPNVKGCDRVENGTRVTNRTAPLGGTAAGAGEERGGDCTAGINKFPISEVAYQRFPVVDTEAGVVLGIGLFHRPPGAKSADGSPRKRNLIHEYFAMDGNRIAGIFAVMRYREQSEADSTGW